MLKNASERFEREYTKYIKSLEESDSELKYDDLLVDSCVEEFMNSCEGNFRIKNSSLAFLLRVQIVTLRLPSNPH